MAINIPIISSLDSKGFEKAALEFKSLETNSQKAGFVMEKAFLPAVAALAGLTAVAGLSVKAAIEDEAAQAQLAKTLQNVTGATEAQIAAVEASIGAMQMATGVSDSELRPAFASLTRGTKNLADANDALVLAMDISAATGKDLQSVSDALALAFGGNTKALAKLSPELKVAIKEGATLDQVMGTLTKTFGGSAAAAAGTAEGQFRRLNVALDEAKESIGKALLPAVEAVLPMLISFGNFAAEHTGVMTGLGIAIAAVTTALIGFKVAQVAANAVSVIAIALGYSQAAAEAAKATAMTFGVAAAAIAAGLVAVGGAMLVYRNQNKQAAVATTDLGTSARSTAVDMGRLGVTLDYIRGTKIAEYMDDWEKKTKKTASGVSDLEKKAKLLAEKTKEAADVLRDYMGKALDDAKDKLDKAQSAFDSFSGSVAQVITDALNFGKAFEEGGEDAGLTFFSALQKQADKTKEFGNLVEQLLAAGLSQDALQQVIDAGIDSGSAIAKELLASSENVLRANTLVEQTQTIAQRIGELSAEKFYGAGVSNAKAYLRGVEEALAAAESRLSRKGITFADVKGISAGFTEAISAPSVSPVMMPNIDELGARRGNTTVNVNVNSQLATKSEIGRAVTDGMRAYNRAAGPANFDVWNS
jgi:hypothetical protein